MQHVDAGAEDVAEAVEGHKGQSERSAQPGVLAHGSILVPSSGRQAPPGSQLKADAADLGGRQSVHRHRGKQRALPEVGAGPHCRRPVGTAPGLSVLNCTPDQFFTSRHRFLWARSINGHRVWDL